MSYRAIILFLLLIFLKNGSFAQQDSIVLLQKLHKNIDSIVSGAIKKEAFPGCVVYASYRGNPIFQKAYGYHTYDSLQPVYTSDLFDLASVTKVLGATMALMKLYEDGLINLDEPIYKYVPYFKHSDFGKVSIRKALSHQAGFKGWIQYYKEIKNKNGKYQRNTISEYQSVEFPFEIKSGMYLHKDFHSKIMKMIRSTSVNKNPGYLYSDLFYYLVPELVQNLSGMSFDEFLNAHFYSLLDAKTICFNPLLQFNKNRIIPTEIDSFFRMETIHGKVHDEGAILMKGISGHAGLFGSIEDVSKLLEMLRNGGEYNGKQFLKQSTIDLFTTYQFPNQNNRRGLGFDKPLLHYNENQSSVAKSSSHLSFGHTGFTGIIVWVDPDKDLVYAFLSNRVYPNRDHKALMDLNVRPTIHQQFYNYIQAE